MTVSTLLAWIKSFFQKTQQLGPTEEPAMGDWYHSLELDSDFWFPSTDRFGADSPGSEQGATVQARPAATGADANAYETTKRAAPNMPEKERQYVLTVARGEGYYGLGWKIPGAIGSNNWGAVQGTGPAGSFVHLDHHADGTPYHADYKRYNTNDEGFLDMARIILKPNVKSALSKGSLREAVYAQHSNGYFELNPEKYLSAVLKNYDRLTSSIPNFPKLLSEKGGMGLLGGIVAIVIGVGGFFLGRKLRGQ